LGRVPLARTSLDERAASFDADRKARRDAITTRRAELGTD
jgi:hypothetical protein